MENVVTEEGDKEEEVVKRLEIVATQNRPYKQTRVKEQNVRPPTKPQTRQER